MNVFIPEGRGASNPYLKRIRIVQGDITEQAVDALVTIIPHTLEYRGALNARILEKAGAKLDEFVLENIVRPRPGDVYAVPGFNLPCKHIFFAVVPKWKNDFDRYDRDLVNVCRQSIELARSMSLKTIAFPPIGSGKHGFPKARASRLIIEGIASRLNAEIDEVRIVCQTKATIKIFKDRLFIV
jgi:O-acetyl-ADP-ribose deacetylase (regulator of RNase III)